MPHVTKQLGNESGVQFQGVTDASSVVSRFPVVGLIIGKFRRGRYDKPMTVSLRNIRALLGHDPKNPDYLAVLQALEDGVPSVQVLRLKETKIKKDLVFREISPDIYHDYVRVFGTLDVKETSLLTLPNINDWKSISKSEDLVSVSSSGVVDINVDYSKAIPFFYLAYSDMNDQHYNFNTQVGLVDIPYVICSSDYLKELSSSAHDANQVAISVKISDKNDSNTGEMSIENVGDYLSMASNFFQDDNGFFLLAELQQAYFYVAGLTGDQKIDISLMNPDGVTVRESLSFERNVQRTTPDPMNNFHLPANESLVITLSAIPEKSVGVFHASLNNGIWNNDQRLSSAHLMLQQGSGLPSVGVGITSGGGCYSAEITGQVITIKGQDDIEFLENRTNTAVATWLFIPGQRVSISEISHNIEYDLKHFSTGTVIYFYLDKM